MKFIEQLTWCRSLAKDYNLSFSIYYVGELLAIACSLSFVVFSKKAIDFAISGNTQQMITALYISVGLILSNLILKLVSTKVNERIKMNMIRDVQSMVIHSQMFTAWNYIKNWSTGDLQFRIQKDCIEIVQMITQVFPNFTLTFIRLIASLSLLWVLDSRLALIIIGIMPLFLFSKIYYKKFRELNKKIKTNEGNLSHAVTENLKYRMLIKSLGIEQYRWSTIEKTQNEIVDIKSKILNFSLVSQTIVKLTVNTGFLFTFIWGVIGLQSGRISFGMMTAFLQLVGRVQNPMLGLLSFFPSFVSFGVSVDRIKEILEETPEKQWKPIKINKIEKITINNISFKYSDQTVLQNISLELKKGKSTAILGASGRGKTTLIRILLSVISPQEGVVKIYYDGKESRINPSFRSNIGYVPQGDKLFTDTIRNNLLLGNTSISEEIINKAIRDACAEFIYNLPQGLDTPVGESGYGLSEGQAQRIALARVLIRDYPIWLFDEITSSLDGATSKKLISQLAKLGKNKIVVYVTHDLQLTESCDSVYYMS